VSDDQFRRQYIVPCARRRSRLVTAWLRQCYCCAGGLTSLHVPVQPSAVSAQRCCAIHRRWRRSYHITDTLASFHWLKVPELVQFKLATIVYRWTVWMAADLCRLSDMPSRRHLRSSLTDQLDVRQSQSSVGDRAFAVAGARLWNSLPPDIVASDTLSRSVVNSKHFYLDSHIPLFCCSVSLWSLRFLPCEYMLSALYAIARSYVCPSVCLSVTWVDQSKTIEVKIIKFSTYGRHMPLVFCGVSFMQKL